MPHALLGALALAGSLVIQTSVPSEVHLDGKPVLKSFSATSTTIPDVPEGPHQVTVYRDGIGRKLEVAIPAQGAVRLLVGSEALDTDTPPVQPTDAAPPLVELRAAPGQSFSLLIDGERSGTLSSRASVVIDDLAVGEHSFELRSSDMLTVWVRGTLILRAGDNLIVRAAEGRMIEVFGREAAWVPLGSDGGTSAPPAGPPPADTSTQVPNATDR